MNYRKLVGVLCCCGLLFLSGCSSDEEQQSPTDMIETQAIESGDYGAVLPFTSSDSRQKHTLTSRNLSDTLNIGTGLLDYSKQHFSSSDYLMQEGQFLSYDILDASDYTTGLLGTERDENPDGLNPNSDTEFDTGNGSVKGAILVRDIYETNFVKNKEIKGLGLVIVMNSQVGDKSLAVTDEKLVNYGEEAGRKLVSYMRKMPEIGDDMPIYIMLYKTASSDDTLPGSFLADAYFEGRSANFSSISEQWVMFPSTTATKLDGSVATQFTSLRNSVYGFLPDDVDVIGRGKFVDSKLTELKITISMHAKTANEAIALTQYVNSLLNTFTSYDYGLTVEVKVQEQTFAVMERLRNEKAVKTIQLQ